MMLSIKKYLSNIYEHLLISSKFHRLSQIFTCSSIQIHRLRCCSTKQIRRKPPGGDARGHLQRLGIGKVTTSATCESWDRLRLRRWLMISVHDGSPDSPSSLDGKNFMENPNLKRMIWGYTHCRTPLYMCIHTYIILVAISSIQWSNPGTLLNQFFKHYKMEKKGLGVVLEGFIEFLINYSFWAKCTL